ncbi:CHAD domain-containing protein [Actinophytocola sp.]|uniref:CHAD domain-containing protein n=1 Tax=Actinophytocola sp. TaxID=1872138 RepID=UPI002ED0E0A4
MTAAASSQRLWIDEQVRELVVNGEVALEGTDPEGVHQLRVAVRRVRAALKVSAFDDDGALLAELRWFFGELGPMRDLDVLLERFRGDTDGFSSDEMAAFERLLKGLRAERTQARRRVTRTLRGKRYLRLLDRLASVDVTPHASGPTDLVGEIARPYRKLRKAVAAMAAEPADQELHDLRIRGKKLRYAAELAAPTGGKAVRRLVKATKRLQDILGEHQDACVAEQRVRGLVGEDAQEAFVAGRLVERERARQAAARGEWREAYLEVNQCAAAATGT